MNERMKILIAYDGSECADVALADLKRAGLPRQAEVIVLSVMEQWLPLPTSFGMVETDFHRQLIDEEKNTQALAQRGHTKVHSLFPEWELHAEAAIGSPGTVLIQKADEWQPDLIVVGSHGRAALGRFFLGSVSQKVVHEAHGSVRVARGRTSKPDEPVRILIGVDGSVGAEAAIQAVMMRTWPKGSAARIVNAAMTIPPITAEHMIGPISQWVASESARVKKMTESALSRLRGIGLEVTSVEKEEDPRHLLCHEAESWEADGIFTGARGMGQLERFLIGSVSSSVAARAHCSVEVVRPA